MDARGRDKEKESPFGPYRPKRPESPFGARPERRPPRNPFAPPGAADPAPPAASRPPRPARPLALLIESTPNGAAAGHVPALPGLCFRAGDKEQLIRVGGAKVVEYLRWLEGEKLADLTPLAQELVKLVAAGFGDEIEVRVREAVAGAPLWFSGEPAALFVDDRYALTDEEVAATFRFARQVVRRMRVLTAGLADRQRVWKPAPDRRSLDETLVHLADSAWWFCSRIDDTLAEAILDPEATPVELLASRVEAAAEHLAQVPFDRRLDVHVPARFPSRDPQEPWTHKKACRREAEHLWEHLLGLPRAIKMAAEA
jgi:hypothetical protein